MTMNPLPPQAYTKDTLTKAYLWLLNQNDSIKELATTPDVLVTLFLKAQRNGDDSLDTPSIQNFKNELKSLAGMMGELEKPSSNRTNGSLNHGTNSSSAPATPAPKSVHGPASSFRASTAMPPFSSASNSSASHSAASTPSTSSASIASAAASSSSAAAAFVNPGFSNGASMSAPSQNSSYQNGPAYNGSSASTPHSSSYNSGTSSSSQHSGATSSQYSGAQSATFADEPSLSVDIIAQLDVKSRAMVGEVREELNLGSDVEVLRLLISLGYKKARNLYS